MILGFEIGPKLLEREFPDKKQRDIAHSLILYRAVKDIVHENEIERWQNGRYKTYNDVSDAEVWHCILKYQDRTPAATRAIRQRVETKSVI